VGVFEGVILWVGVSDGVLVCVWGDFDSVGVNVPVEVGVSVGVNVGNTVRPPAMIVIFVGDGVFNNVGLVVGSDFMETVMIPTK
jgi:hypothetical protein